MQDFLYLFRGGDPVKAGLSPEMMQRHMQRFRDWMGSLRERGYLKGADPLAPTGKLVEGRHGPVTDGPFAEAKDVVGGYALICAESIDQAVDLALDCPICDLGGSIEVRPLRVMGG
jgi:hypothetical protein